MKKPTAFLAAAALAVSSTVAFEAPAIAQGQPDDKAEFCRFLIDILGFDVPLGDCVSDFAGGRSAPSFCRFLIQIGAIPQEEFSDCVSGTVGNGN